MFIAPIDFKEVRKWFLKDNTSYHHLCMFLTGNGEYNEIINEEILRNRYLIDRTTGNGICYFFCSSFGVESDFFDFDRWNIRNRELTMAINRALSDDHSNGISPSLQSELLREDVCDFYNIPRSALPALVFISKKEEIFLYPIKDFKDIKALLTPLGIISDFVKDSVAIENLEACKTASINRFKELNLNVDAEIIINQSTKDKSGTWLIPVLKASQERKGQEHVSSDGKTKLKCFIAGAKVLERERDAIVSGINDQNIANKHSKRYIECYSFNNFDSHLTKEGQQEAYDSFIKDQADVVIFALDEVVGGVTKREFSVAVEALKMKDYKAPKIFVFSNKGNEGKTENPDIKEVREQVNLINQYWIDYSSLEVLKLKLQLKVDSLYD